MDSSRNQVLTKGQMFLSLIKEIIESGLHMAQVNSKQMEV